MRGKKLLLALVLVAFLCATLITSSTNAQRPPPPPSPTPTPKPEPGIIVPFSHEYGPYGKYFPETTWGQVGKILVVTAKPVGLPLVFSWILLSKGSTNPNIERERRLKYTQKNWPPPEHLLDDHTSEDGKNKIVTWYTITTAWRVDFIPPDHCYCNADKTKCIICYDKLEIYSPTNPNRVYEGGCILLKYPPAEGPSTAIYNIQIDQRSSWFDPEKSDDPFVMCPVDRCPPWTFNADYNRRKGVSQ